MMQALLPGLAPVQLEKIADMIERLGTRGDHASLVAGLGMDGLAPTITIQLRARLNETSPLTVAAILRAVAAERRASERDADRRLELVWTGPERDGTATRDTAVAVRELFSAATEDVLVAGYALYNARPIFEPLADRMEMHPTMRVRVIVNISYDSSASVDSLLSSFRSSFRKHHWPGAHLPAVYYDPRATESNPAVRAVMHAKCVVADGARCLLTSANLTEAAHARNVELGVIVNDPVWCRRVVGQFDDLIANSLLKQLDF